MEEKFTRKITQDDFVTEKNDIIKNNLLGNYDENNEYHISSQIVEELIDIDKLKKSSFGNSVFCVGNLLGYGEIVFEVVYNNKTNNTSAQAFLFVLENVDKINGYLQNTIRTQIAHFSSELDDFIEESYKKFNIVGTLDDEGREKKNLEEMSLDDSYILAKKAYSLLLDKLADEKILDAYGKYFTARLAALTKFDNPFTNDVLARFNEEYTLIHGVFLQQKNYKTLNELLDKCIEESSGTKEEFVQYEVDFNNAIKPDLDKFITSVQTINEKSEDKAIDMLERSDRDKIKEILASNEKFEKDLSDESLVNYNAIAPKQSIETLANEIEELTSKDGEVISKFESVVSQEDDSELAEEQQIEEQQIEEVKDNVSVDGDSDIDPVVQEMQEEKEADEEDMAAISKFFEDGIKEDSFESEEESDEIEEVEEKEEVVEDPVSLFDELKDFVEDSSLDEEDEVDSEIDELDKEIDKITLQREKQAEIQAEKQKEILEATPEEDIIEEVQQEEEIVENENIDNLNSEFKENASMSVYDRLNMLNSNMKKSKKTYQREYTPNTNSKDNKLDRLYDLLDRTMDR